MRCVFIVRSLRVAVIYINSSQRVAPWSYRPIRIASSAWFVRRARKNFRPTCKLTTGNTAFMISVSAYQDLEWKNNIWLMSMNSHACDFSSTFHGQRSSGISSAGACKNWPHIYPFFRFFWIFQFGFKKLFKCHTLLVDGGLLHPCVKWREACFPRPKECFAPGSPGSSTFAFDIKPVILRNLIFSLV